MNVISLIIDQAHALVVVGHSPKGAGIDDAYGFLTQILPV